MPDYPCPSCRSLDTVHSGYLHQAAPDGPRIDPPAPLLKCYDCKHTFRADGEAFDERAIVRAWRDYRYAESSTAPPLPVRRAVSLAQGGLDL